MAKRPAPRLYSATQALHDHGLMVAKAKRITLNELVRQMTTLKVNIDRILMRLSKAHKAGDLTKGEHLAKLLSRSQAAYLTLVEHYEQQGGTMVHSQEPKPANWRAKGVRRHPERQASKVRNVPLSEG